jgi:hypothetical protein
MVQEYQEEMKRMGRADDNNILGEKVSTLV